jgi:copper chaperone CopZ
VRKVFAFGLAVLALMAFATAPIFAQDAAKPADTKDKASCEGKTAASKAECAKTCAAAKASSVNGKAICPGMSGAGATEAKMISAEGAKCATMSKEECAKLCGGDGKCDMISLSIKGMTCTGCEQTITTALQGIEGVKKVAKISYKDGYALVCSEKGKVNQEALLTAISNKGYEAQVIPAVATTTVSGKGKVCSPENKAACAKEKEAEKTGIEGTK